MEQSKEVKLLWTGGWDSTFRLLQLIDNKEVFVKPYYIIDTARASTTVEIKTLSKLKKLIKQYLPDAYQYLGAFNFFSIHEIEENEEISQSYHVLKSRSYLGGQYDWLARFTAQNGISGLELSVHRDDTTYPFLKDNVVLSNITNLGEIYELNKEISDKDLTHIFKSFRFPLLDWTKLKMNTYSEEQGWTEIMNATWFCHRPLHGKPCGICNPCRYTIQEGMGRRLPNQAKTRYLLRYLYDFAQFIKKGLKFIKKVTDVS